jgi:hypothetical protein
MRRFSIFLVVVALMAGVVGCAGPAEEEEEEPQYELTIDSTAGGQVTTPGEGTFAYTEGTAVNLVATPDECYHFVNWTASAGEFADANAAETTFTVPAQNAVVAANFALFAGGTGTEADPYQIEDWYQLSYVSNHLDSCFMLMDDLDSNSAGYEELASPTANEAKGWQPIGGWFCGTFDGQEYEIRNLFVDRPDEGYVGLFAAIDRGATINNIGVVNTTVTGGFLVGSLVGRSFGRVSNCYAEGMVTSVARVASNDSDGDGLPDDGYGLLAGGLVGTNDGRTVSNCHFRGRVTGYGFVGGLAGGNSGNVSNCYSNAEVTGSGRLVGGLLGHSGDGGTVSSCHATGTVTGGYEVAGLAGMNTGTISNCYASANVTGDHGVGGLAGVIGAIDNSGRKHGGIVSNCYSTGRVTGNYGFGGLIAGGLEYEGAAVNSSFWDIESSATTISGGGTWKTTAQMKNLTTFAGWNIVAVANPDARNPSYVWNIVDGETYPFLSWQPISWCSWSLDADGGTGQTVAT